MTRTISSLRSVAFAAAVAGALGFGALHAQARPGGELRSTCRDPAADGACTTANYCRALCQTLYGAQAVGYCATATRCCYCAV